MGKSDNEAMITRLEWEDREVILLGTAHVSKESAEQVARVIEEERPDTVSVELCQSRYNAIRQRDKWRNMDIVKVIKEKKAFQRAGEEYPSGVPVSHMLDLWKHAAPSIDLIAPDVYVLDYAGYRDICSKYGRDDNALLIPETGWSQAFAGYLFYALTI